MDSEGFPIRHAQITLNDTTKVTGGPDGRFAIPAANGEYILQIYVPGYFNTTRVIVVNDKTNEDRIIDLLKDTRILGFPKPVFVILCGSGILGVLIFAICAYNLILCKKKDRYKFHKISESTGLFEDDDYDLCKDHNCACSDSDEEELYNSSKLWKHHS